MAPSFFMLPMPVAERDSWQHWKQTVADVADTFHGILEFFETQNATFVAENRLKQPVVTLIFPSKHTQAGPRTEGNEASQSYFRCTDPSLQSSS